MSIHHIRPRRLLKIAEEAGAGEDYSARLRALINHPANKRLICRILHDFVDFSTTDELPSEDELESFGL